MELVLAMYKLQEQKFRDLARVSTQRADLFSCSWHAFWTAIRLLIWLYPGFHSFENRDPLATSSTGF